MSINGANVMSPERLADLVQKAQKAGADHADAIHYSGSSSSVSWRLGKLEDLERSENADLGLRVIIGKNQAIVSSSDMSDETLDELVSRSMDMARNTPEDPFSGLADKGLLAMDALPDLDLCDPKELDEETLKNIAAEAEAHALEFDGISNSEGAGASASTGHICLANSDGFVGHYSSSNFGCSVSVIAGEGTSMERDYSWTSKRHFADMESPYKIAKEAAERTLKKLNPHKASTCEVPVVYDPRVSRTLIGHLAGAINGAGIARGTSFLIDMMEKQVFSSAINIIDNPHIARGPSSKPFDGEGVRNAALDIIKDGVLQTWVLDSTSARQLDLISNGRASRGTSSPPSPTTTNFYMEAGSISVKDLLGDIKDGFYVTELIGSSVNSITGDYSRGASGFWIENGELTYPVNEITIAGNLKDMYLNMTAADDLEIRYGTDAPTLRIEKMMIAGS
ncbi:MAG: TldD/PmbA family protein [Kordiimonadaceae bacterium]|jgi:PmbA protein|nr:TldD/PmbA family protein [Kordiimonadaceae bacterium]MBT6032070.1 TldD/PmbA family protein [Kordiimonadaceae bacterium]